MIRKLFLGAMILMTASAWAQDNVAGGGSGGGLVKTNNTSAGTRIPLEKFCIKVSGARGTDVFSSPNLSDPVIIDPAKAKETTKDSSNIKVENCSRSRVGKPLHLNNGDRLHARELFTSSSTGEKFYALYVKMDACADQNQMVYIPVAAAEKRSAEDCNLH